MQTARLVSEDNQSYDLGCFFSYQPYIPKKRKKTKQTSKGSFTQYSVPLFLHGLEFIEFKYEGITSQMVNELTELYSNSENYTFFGSYNEEYLVDFCTWEVRAKGGFFTAKGQFRVICVEQPFAPTCEE